MNKKLLIAAVGAALVAGPMMAAHAAPTVYGHFHMSFDNVDNSNAKYGYVASNTTRIGVKGDEDLGGGLKGIYQIETGSIAADTGAAGLGNTLRNTYLGFTGSWGAVKIGRYDTPFKEIAYKVNLFLEEVGDPRNLLSGSLSSTVTPTRTVAAVSNPGASIYDARVSNMIRYESPVIGGGLTVNAMHTSNDGTEGPAPAATGKAINSVSANWTSGPLFLGAAVQRDSFNKSTTVTKEHDSAWRLVGAYNMDALMVSLIYQNLSDIGGMDLKQKAMGVAASYKMANNLIKFEYLTADDFKGSGVPSDTGGKLWALGLDHVFSKTTKVYVDYSKAANDSNSAAYSVISSNGGHGENLLPGTTGAGTGTGATGKDVKAISAGMVLNF